MEPSRQKQKQRQKLTREEEGVLWERVAKDKDQEARCQLIDYHLETARIVAAKLYANRPTNEVEFADYMQYATVGLIEAVDRYDPGQEAAFPTYASYRIHGAVLNGLQKETERLEQGAFKKRLREERLAALKSGAGASRDPFKEMAEIAVGLALGYMLEDCGLYHDQDRVGGDPYASLALKNVQERIKMIVEALPERERLVIRYHYYQYMSFTNIAEVLNLTKGRISQIHSRALELLREALDNWGSLDTRY